MIKEWQDPNAFPCFPKHFIVCPLDQGQLKFPYSLASIDGITPFYLKQEEAMVELFKHPPFTIAILTKKGSKKRVVSMGGTSPSTLETRVKVMRDFIGFTTKWLNLPITMDHVLNPQVVAKYFGFHVAKGNQWSYMKNMATHLHKVAIFATMDECPKTIKLPSKDKEASIMDWYENLTSHLLASVSTHFQAKEVGITLHRVWEAIGNKYDTFLSKLKVSGWREEGGLP